MPKLHYLLQGQDVIARFDGINFGSLIVECSQSYNHNFFVFREDEHYLPCMAMYIHMYACMYMYLHMCVYMFMHVCGGSACYNCLATEVFTATNYRLWHGMSVSDHSCISLTMKGDR